MDFNEAKSMSILKARSILIRSQSISSLIPNGVGSDLEVDPGWSSYCTIFDWFLLNFIQFHSISIEVLICTSFKPDPSQVDSERVGLITGACTKNV
jgi:hypothetical protein